LPRPALFIKLLVSASKAEILLDMDRDEWLVGRSDPLRGIFPEVDLGPHGGDKSGVSRRHAKLVTQAGGRWILDLNSTNFTILNGDQLRPGELYPLQHGDEIRFGLLALVFIEGSVQ
jgi:pSer/pThr/pTyr-binding forkhead associated (FHA) protein